MMGATMLLRKGQQCKFNQKSKLNKALSKTNPFLLHI